MYIQKGIAPVNGTELYYECAGEGDPLVLIHGFSLDTRMWNDQFETYAAHFKVVRYDLRGFGRSSVPDGTPFSPADDLKALLDFLEIRTAHILGLSLGGWVATNFVLAYPKKVDRLILADSVLLGLEWSSEYLAATNPIWEAAGIEGLEAAKELWLETPLFTYARRQKWVGLQIAQMISDYSGFHFLQGDGSMYASDALERLKKITNPTLVIIGEHDIPDFQNISDTLLKIPGAYKVVLAGAGHMSNMEVPVLFNQAVLEFLQQP